jgi:NADH-quinone oxidoreductase subunit F
LVADRLARATVAGAFVATLAPFPRERRWLLPALQAIQDAEGHLSLDALAATAAHLRVPASEVYGVTTHYPELRVRPHGRHHVRVCTGVTCSLVGGRDVCATIERRVGDRGASDVTIEEADCFFACSVAPLVEVDGAYHGRVTSEDVARIERWFGEERDATIPSASTSAGRIIVHPQPESDVGGRKANVSEGRPSPSHDDRSAETALDRRVSAARERRGAVAALRLLVQTGTCGRAVGADEVLAALRDATARRGLRADVVAGACNGMCYAAPLATVARDGWPRFVVERLTPGTVAALVDTISSEDASFSEAGLTGVVWAESAWRGLAPATEHPFWRGQERLLLRRAGTIDPESFDDALLDGAYRSLARALDGSPERVIAEVKGAGLQGRGGAFFPAAVKWETCRNAAGATKYLVMNGEEGEPGIFKDRHLMEADPHQVLEGALIGAYASGATHVILYVHGEADLAAARLARAIDEARAAGIVGPRMLGRDVGCAVEIRRGAGGFVLGEETALLESIEGRRAQPRTRPPFPVESGLWAAPTVINNVETLSAVPAILERGAASFVALGTPKAPGTKVFGLSGAIARSGVVETRNGVTLGDLLHRIGGGPRDERPVIGAVVGGPSGSIVPAALFDTPMEPRGKVSPGTGGIVAVPAGASIRDIVKTLLAFNARESCGKCTPCREGAPRLLALLDELVASARADRAAQQATLQRIRDLGEAMQLASLCGLGQAAPLSLLRALETFPADFALDG